MKIHNHISVWALTALFTIVLSSCGNKESKPENVSETTTHAENENEVILNSLQYNTVGIVLGSPEKRSLSGILKVNGYIDVPPQNLISITTQMGGAVKYTPLLQGSEVRKGEIIAILENPEYVTLQQDFLESKNQLTLTLAEYKRQQTLAEQNVNSQKILQQAKANYESKLIQVNALKKQLQLINIQPEKLSPGNIRSQINIYSPINGYVTKVNVNLGKFVNSNDVLFEIVNASNLHVELKAFEENAAKIRTGQKVYFNLANDSERRTATVELVGKEINADKTITVHCIANGTSAHFIPGTYVKAFIETGNHNVLSVPEAAVADYEGNKYIFISTDSSGKNNFHFKMIPVTTGISDAGFVQIDISQSVDYLNKTVLKGAYDLLSKLKNSEED